MKKVVFSGAAVAIVTPFRGQGVDFDKLGALCEMHIASGTDAIVVAGTTGEASTMPDEEHLSVIAYVIRKVAGRIPVIAGTGSNDTAHGVQLCREAEKLGADALLLVSPYYNKASQKGLFLHFKAMADAVRIPIILYNVPGRTGVNIAPETVASLSLVENIVGLKECNTTQAPEVAALCGDRISLYSGEDGQVLPVLSLGGRGVISVMANVIPADTHRMVASYLAGDPAEALRIQLKTVPLVKALFSDVNPIPVKAALNLLGHDVGECRLPLCAMSDSALTALREALVGYGLLR
jgi:4-hydroxy-tetrahydrodipicolinate synthase